MKAKLFFPHFYRRINALPFIIFIAILSVNLLSSFIPDADDEKKNIRQIMLSPFDSQLHEKLGRYYLEVNLQAAQREYLMAEEFYQSRIISDGKIAGIQSPPWQTFLNLIGKRDKIRKDLIYWEKVTKNFPDYQYAKLKLAVLHAQLGEKNKGKDLLEKVLRDNPTNHLALSLREKLK